MFYLVKLKIILLISNWWCKIIGTLWEANIDAQFILDSCVAIRYCPYLTKTNKFVTQKMKSKLKKCKIE